MLLLTAFIESETTESINTAYDNSINQVRKQVIYIQHDNMWTNYNQEDLTTNWTNMGQLLHIQLQI